MFENFVKTYPKAEEGPAFTHTTTVRHNGTVIAFAMNDQRRIFYSVLDLGDQRSKGPIDVNYWQDNPRELVFPNEVETVGEGLFDPRKMPVFKIGSGTPEAPNARVRDNEKDHFRSTTATLSAGVAMQVLSDNKFIYVFRQSRANEDVGVAADTMLVDRYVLAGTTLAPKREVRFQRSRNKHRPESRKDGLGAKDMEKKPFFEPTQKLEFIRNLTDGRFTALIVPTQIANVQRWQVFAYNNKTKVIDSFNIERSIDGLFNLRGSNLFVRPDSDTVPPLNGNGDTDRKLMREGYAEWALRFNGTTSVTVKTQINVAADAYTLELWLRPDGFANPQTLLRVADQELGGIQIDGEGKLQFAWSLGSDGAGVESFGSLTALEAGAWSHIALIVDNEIGMLSWFINGELTNSLEPGDITFPSLQNQKPVLGGSNAGFAGLIDEVRMWSRARFDEELVETMQHRLIGYEPSLTLYWRMDEGGGKNVRDQTDNANHATIKGTATWQESDAPIGDHPGVRRSSFTFDGRDVVTGMSALLYYHQENNKSGYDAEEKPLKTKARVMLATATHPVKDGEAGKNHIAILDFGLSRDGRLGQIPDNLKLKNVEVTGDRARTSRDIQEQIAFWEQREAEASKRRLEFDGTIEVPGYDPALSAADRVMAAVSGSGEVDDEVILAKDNVRLRLRDGKIFFEELPDDAPAVLSLANWTLPTNEVVQFERTTAGATVSAVEVIPDPPSNGKEDENDEPQPSVPDQNIVGTPEWLAAWTEWDSGVGSREAALVIGTLFFYFKGDAYMLFDWSKRSFTGPVALDDGVFPGLWSGGVDAAHTTTEATVAFHRRRGIKQGGVRSEFKTYTVANGVFTLSQEGNLDELYHGAPFVFLHNEYRDKSADDIDAELKGELEEATQELLRLRAELAQAQARELENLEVEIEMHLIHADPFGLTALGGLLMFAWAKGTPQLFDSANGKLALYFQGVDDQFFVAYYDTMTSAVNMEIPAGGVTNIVCIPRMVGPMAEAVINIEGDDAAVCNVMLQNPTMSVDEVWRDVPRDATKLAAVVNGTAEPVLVAELAEVASGDVGHLNLSNVTLSDFREGSNLVFGSQSSRVKRLTQNVALSFADDGTFVELPEPVIGASGTIEIWIKLNGDGDQTIFDVSTQEPADRHVRKYFAIYIGDGMLRFDLEDADDEDTSGEVRLSSLDTGDRWHHLVAVWQFGDSGFARVYWDGRRVINARHLNGQPPEYLNPFVGKPRGEYYTSGEFDGDIAELSLHATALAAKVIKSRHAAGVFGVSPDGTMASIRFEESGDVIVARDLSVNGVEATVNTGTLTPVGPGTHRVDIEPIQLTEDLAVGSAVYAMIDFTVAGRFANGRTGKRSMLFAMDASKAEGVVGNTTVLGSSANSPMTRWVAYAQGSTLELDGRSGRVVPKDADRLVDFDAPGDVTLESWIRPEPATGTEFSRVVHHNSTTSMYALGFRPSQLKSAMLFNAADTEKAYAWAARQVWNRWLGNKNWAFEAANAAIKASSAGQSVSEIATAAEKSARKSMQAGFWFFFFWSNHERDRVGRIAREWAIAWARTHKDYVEIANETALNPNSDQWTVELWFRADRTTGPNILYNKQELYEAQVNNGYFEYAWHPNWVWEKKVFPVARGQWYHVAIVYDGARQRVYRNGGLVYERDQIGPIGSSSFPLLVGARHLGNIQNPPVHFFKGAVDEVRVWAVARTREQILNNQNKRLLGDEAGLVGYWHFEQDLARDYTSNAGHGLIHDSPHTVDSVMPGYAVTAGVGNRIEGGFTQTFIQATEPIPYFDWNHFAASFNASYGLRFRSDRAFVDCGNSSSLDLGGDLTIEVFFRLDDLLQPRGLLAKGDALPGYSLYIDLQGRVVFTFADEEGGEQVFVTSADSALAAGKFYRVGAVRRHQSSTRDVERRESINGEVVTINVPEVVEWDDIEIHICEWKGNEYQRRFGVVAKYGGPNAGENTDNLLIGRASSRTSTPFKGVITEVRVWSRGLGPLETCQNIIGVESGLVSWWRFDENQGYVADDVTRTNPANITEADWVQNPDPLGSAFAIYHNGVQMETAQIAPPPNMRAQTGFWVGPHDKAAKDAFKGTVEELRIWRTARTQEQIQDNMFLRLIGEKEDLIAYYTFDQNENNELKDLSFRGNHLLVTDAVFVVSDAPIGYDTFKTRNALVGVKTDFHDRLQGQPGVQEYGDLQFDSEGNLIGVLKRCYAFIQDGQWVLVTGFKVGNLVTEWIGQVQFNPELKGYVEGAPPVPSENLTAGPVDPAVSDYAGASSVEVVEADNIAYTYSTSKEAGLNASFGLSAKVGVDTTVLMITAPLGIGTATEIADVNVLVGLEGKFSAGAAWSSENTVGAGRNLTKSTEVTLGGNWEDPTKPLNPAMQRRYQPANVGFALVQSETADVFALRLEHNLALVSFQFRPNPDIPKDWNIIPFPINPRYTKQGTLDGGVGYSETGKVLDPDWPNAAVYGQHSYFKPKEAYSLKNRIVKDEQELINYFRSVDTNLGGAPDLAISAGLGLIDGATSGGAKGAIDGLVAALGSSGLPEKIGKQNIVNTYVWTAEGGFFAETTEVTSMKQETTGGTFSFSGEVGATVGADFSVGGVDVSLGFSAMLGGSLNLSKTKTTQSEESFNINVRVDVTGDLQAYDDNLNRLYDAEGNPIIVAGKVDAYRFMTFYLEPTNENFDTFFDTVVDPIWLAGNHPNALALKQAQQSDKKPPCWRVMHRVTFISRVLPEIPADTAPPIEKKMRAANVESNWQLVQKLDPFVRNRTGSFVEFSDAVRKAIRTQLPALMPHADEVIQFLGAYYQVFEDV